MRRPKKRTITCDCRNFIEWYEYTLYHFCIPKDLPAKPMIRIIVWIQYFKLLFKLNEQTAQCIIWHACNLCFISFWKNRGVTVIIRSRIRSNIWMVMFLKHHNDRSGSLILDLTRKSCFIYRTGFDLGASILESLGLHGSPKMESPGGNVESQTWGS